VYWETRTHGSERGERRKPLLNSVGDSDRARWRINQVAQKYAKYAAYAQYVTTSV
jgi:hypothetical protein